VDVAAATHFRVALLRLDDCAGRTVLAEAIPRAVRGVPDSNAVLVLISFRWSEQKIISYEPCPPTITSLDCEEIG